MRAHGAASLEIERSARQLLAHASHQRPFMNDVGPMLLGAGLVAIGVLAAALADRIRGIRVARETGHQRASRRLIAPIPESAEPPRSTNQTRSRAESRVRASTQTATDGAEDVIAALVAAGYKRQIAVEATHACGAADRATVEGWARAALSACLRRGAA